MERKFYAALCAAVFFISACASAWAEPVIEIIPRHPVIPSIRDAENELRITLQGSPTPVECQLMSSSALGVFLPQSGDEESQSLTISLSNGVPQIVRYRYTGPDVKSAPIPETVTAAAHTAQGSASFDVGMSLVIASISAPPGYAGVPLPLSVEIQDKFHPGGNILAWIAGQKGRLKFSVRAHPMEPQGLFVVNSGNAEYTLKKVSDKWLLNSMYNMPGIIASGTGLIKIEMDGDLFIGDNRSPVPMVTQEIAVENEVPEGVSRWLASELKDGRQATPEVVGATAAAIGLMRTDSVAAGTCFVPLVRDLGGDVRFKLESAALNILAFADNEGLAMSLLRGIVRGYEEGKWSLLVISRGGVQSLALEGSSSPLGQMSPKYRVIAFHRGTKPTIIINGNGKTDVALHKIVPEGINVKIYPAGKWTRRIAVYPGGLAPPVQK